MIKFGAIDLNMISEVDQFIDYSHLEWLHQPLFRKKSQILLLNDDYTPLEFVYKALKKIFHLSDREAQHLAIQTHEDGVAICGQFSDEIAEMKVHELISYARKFDHPLLCVIQKK